MSQDGDRNRRTQCSLTNTNQKNILTLQNFHSHLLNSIDIVSTSEKGAHCLQKVI